MKSALGQTREIFTQVADTDGAAGVRVVIETHDAWMQGAEVLVGLTPALRAQVERMSRPAAVAARIARQRAALTPLVTRIGARAIKAG
jgi:hypothetical protein